MSKNVLGLSGSNYAATQKGYPARVEDDRIENHNRDQINTFAGHLTASFVEVFHVSGAIVAGQYYGGLRVNTDAPRHLNKVVGIVPIAGSSGVNRIDIRKTGEGSNPESDLSIFSDNVFKLILSQSAGTGSFVETSTFAPGSSSWKAGEVLGVVIEEAAVAAGDLVVQLHWTPSASFA